MACQRNRACKSTRACKHRFAVRFAEKSETQLYCSQYFGDSRAPIIEIFRCYFYFIPSVFLLPVLLIHKHCAMYDFAHCQIWILPAVKSLPNVYLEYFSYIRRAVTVFSSFFKRFRVENLTKPISTCLLVAVRILSNSRIRTCNEYLPCNRVKYRIVSI